MIALLVLCVVAAHGADALLFEDKFDMQSLGKASGVTFEDGNAVFDAPGDTIEYKAEDFAGPAGRIEFDVKLTKPLSIERPIWCILSDIGSGGSHPGAINVHWRDKPADFEFGIFDASAHNWCIAKGIDWSAGHHVTLVYGPTGMRLEIDGKIVDRNDYKGGLANTSKRIGWDDPWNDAPPCTVDNFRTYRTMVDRLATSGPIISPNDDGLLDKCTITYGIESDSKVTLTVADRVGDVIAKLVDAKVDAGEYTVTWDGKGAEDGEHTITMRADSRQLMAKITVDRRWKWKEAPPMYNDFFPLGTWFFWEDDASYINRHVDDMAKAREYYEHTVKDLADHGFNMVFGIWTPHDHRKLLLDTAQKNDMKVILQLDEINTLISSGEVGEKQNVFEVAENAVKEVKGHPATIGYYMIDEPNNAPEVARRIKLARQALETVDPKHPGFSCLLGGYEELLKTVDYQVLMIDIYPLHPTWSGDWNGYISELERGMRNQGDRPLWVILQAFGKPNNAWKIPTAEEIRAQVWLALAHGAKGIIYFIYQSTTGFQGEWLQGLVDMDLKPMDGRLAEVGRVNEQVTKLAPLLLKLRPAEFTLPTVPEQVLGNGFVDPKGVKYIILANKDVKYEAMIPWTAKGPVDMFTESEIVAAVKLPPGGGIVICL
jgi:hypothetical protein